MKVKKLIIPDRGRIVIPSEDSRETERDKIVRKIMGEIEPKEKSDWWTPRRKLIAAMLCYTIAGILFYIKYG